jgi:hypothetical protein
MVADDELRIGAAIIGRFYGDGLTWALALPLPDLFAWGRLMKSVTATERGE